MMGIEFSPAWLLAGFLVSTVGFGLFLYGKKQTRMPQLLAGLAMMVYPSFVASPLVIYAIGAALVGGVWFAARTGA